MKSTMTLHVEAGGGYDICVSPGILDSAGEHIRAALPKARRLYCVTDGNVAPLYLDRLTRSVRAAGLEAVCRIVPAGEATKCAAALLDLWEWMAEEGVTRTDGVVALGGGVVGDLAGFAAATILRGVGLAQIPTTLLAQVDSSVGGKTAIDLEHGKNLAGAFYQPDLVLIDPDTLSTLPDKVFMSGMAEVIKYGLIWDREFFDFLTARPTREALTADIGRVLLTCCGIKRDVVERDTLDRGLRMILNFGHTLGHAYELAGGYSAWSHGEAVSAGMVAAARLGVELGVTPPELPGVIERALAPLGLPTKIRCGWQFIEKALGTDKKGSGDELTLILLDDIGSAREVRLKKDLILQSLRHMEGVY